ncbi:MAG: hypothetical protein ACI35K_00395, partial [Campylobacter sp.]
SLTNGKISDNSPGVKVLSPEEAKQVKGGYEISQPYIFNDTQINNFRITEIGVLVALSSYELKNKVSCGVNSSTNCSTSSYTNKQRYKDFISIANIASGEYLAVTSIKTSTPTMFGVPRTTYQKSAKVVTIHNGMMKQVRSVSRTNRIVNEVYRAKGNELNRILFSKY